MIYIIEDDDDDRLLLSFELEDNGFGMSAHFFSNIQELIDFSNSSKQKSPPSLILLNAYMPMIDLQHAAARIQSVEGLRTVPLIVMLVSKREKEYFQRYNLNVSGYIVKPASGRILKRFLKIR